MTQLETVCHQMLSCTDCALSRGRTQVVVGEGPANASIMFIGEGPGYHEDRLGRPFVGPAGHILDELLASIGLQRSQVYITNMVKCRPPNNRDPLPGEVQACSKWLDQQLQLIRPKVIVTLGRHSLAKFFPKETVTKARGKPRKLNGVIYYPMYHPAAALHQQSLRKIIEEDIKKLPQLLKEAEHLEESAERQEQQLSMF